MTDVEFVTSETLIGNGDSVTEWLAVIENARCPACGDFFEFEHSHGDISDSAAYCILEMHATDNHTTCHANSECRMSWSDARKRFDESLDETHGLITIAGIRGYATSRALARTNPADYRMAFNDWCEANRINTDCLVGPVDMP